MTADVRLLETMRATAGVGGVGSIRLWPLHRARLSASAEEFGIPLNVRALEGTLGDALALVDEDFRVRLTVGHTGDAVVETGEVAAPPTTVWADPEPFLDARTRYCIHKTTHRAHYDRRLERARAAGADDALLFGDDGRLVESTRANVWVGRDGRLLTPPLAAGGLPGVMRAHLLAARDDTAEAALTRADVASADSVWLSNAVVGLVRVSFLPSR